MNVLSSVKVKLLIDFPKKTDNNFYTDHQLMFRKPLKGQYHTKT